MSLTAEDAVSAALRRVNPRYRFVATAELARDDGNNLVRRLSYASDGAEKTKIDVSELEEADSTA